MKTFAINRPWLPLLVVGVMSSILMMAEAFAMPSNHQRHKIQPMTPQITKQHDSTRLLSAKTEPGHVDASVLTDGLLAALSKMDKVQDPKFFNQISQLKTLNSQIVKSLEVKKSSIPGAGLGLFATKNIKAGSIVSFYPAHSLGIEHGEEFLFVSNTDQNKDYFRQHPPETSSYLHATDQPIFNRRSIVASIGPELRNEPLYLDVNPNLPVSPAWLSHYINDGANMRENSVAGVEDYYQNSKAKKNCIHVPFGPSPILATVATKKIQKGDELLTSYGCVYWIGVQYRHQESAPMTAKIQGEIRESAQDLFGAMNTVSTRCKTATEALEAIFRDM